MDHQKFEENSCRICLLDGVIVDWNEYLQNHGHITYKECYYKYTQLDCLDETNVCLPTMLCCNCSSSLENIYGFISKAVENHKFLQERLAFNVESKNEEIDENIQTNFETVLFSEIDVKPEIQDLNLYEATSEENLYETGSGTVTKDESSMKVASVFENIEKSKREDNSSIKLVDTNEDFAKDRGKKDQQNTTEDSNSIIQQSGIKRKRKSVTGKRERKRNKNKVSSDELQTEKPALKKKKIHPTCCSICSKVLHSKYRAIEHEKTHAKNRERTETCVQCGVKFFDKCALSLHMLTHNENREKTRKCEFCDKAFYNTGALNVHRRIHLGQMIKCTLCKKEYCRQVDLDIHMKSHSVSKISDDLKPNKKYYVRCEICEKTIRSPQYKEHAARHLNEPLAKCTICNKEFFSRASCANHVNKVHKKALGERSKFVIAYKTTRLSNLFLQQSVGAFTRTE